MANSKVYYVGTTASLGTTFNSKIGNTAHSSSPITTALVANNYYAYIDGYTSNASGSQQGTGIGYQVKIVFRFGSPDTTKRTVPLYVAAYFRRADHVGSNNTLTLKLVSNETVATYSQMTSLNSKWLRTICQKVTVNYTDKGTAVTTVQLTGSNDTGSCKSITCKFQIQAPNIESKSKVANLTLSAAKATLGTTELTLTHDQLTNIKTNVSITFKDVDGTTTAYGASIASSNTTKVLKYTPPLTIANKLPTRTSVNATIVCTSYDSSSNIIGRKTYPITLQLPSNIKHVISELTITDSDGKVPSGGYKIGQHKLRAAIKIDSSKAYGSTIDKVVIKFGTETVTFTKDDGNIEEMSNGIMYVTSSKAIESTSQAITATITDSRGRTSTKTTSISAGALESKPSVTILNVGRGTGTNKNDFVDNDKGGNCKVKYTVVSNRTVTEIANGSVITSPAITVTIEYKKISESTFTTYSYTTPDNITGVLSDEVIIPLNDTDNAYVIRVTATDKYGTIYRETNLSSAFVLMDIYKTGRGLAIGEVASEDSFVIKMITKFHDTVYNSSGAVAMTSDETKKHDIKPLSEMFDEDLLLDFFTSIDPISFKYNNQENELNHFGFSANKIKEILENNNIDTSLLSIVEKITETHKDQNTGEETTDSFLTLRYEEIIPLLVLFVKILLRELYNINTRLEKVEKEK